MSFATGNWCRKRYSNIHGSDPWAAADLRVGTARLRPRPAARPCPGGDAALRECSGVPHTDTASFDFGHRHVRPAGEEEPAYVRRSITRTEAQLLHRRAPEPAAISLPPRARSVTVSLTGPARRRARAAGQPQPSRRSESMRSRLRGCVRQVTRRWISRPVTTPRRRRSSHRSRLIGEAAGDRLDGAEGLTRGSAKGSPPLKDPLPSQAARPRQC